MMFSKTPEIPITLTGYLAVTYVLTSTSLAYSNDNPWAGTGGENYGVFMDAGSSSTKLNIYRWKWPKHNLLPRIDLISKAKFDTAVTTYRNDYPGLMSYLDDILMRAKQDVPQRKHEETPIFFMATSGLRVLSAQHAKSFLENIKLVMANKNINPFLYVSSNVRILSGEKEAMYSWIAANYLLGFFDTIRPENEPVGVLEMGGGSTQISFMPTDPILSEEYQVTLNGRYFQLYVQSYLHYGSTAIKHKLAHMISHRYPDEDDIKNPCMLRGDISKSTKLEDGRIITEIGTGSPNACLKLLHEILMPHTGIHCYPKPCAIGSVYQPSVGDTQFYATGAFSYAPEALGVIEKDRVLHIDKLEEAAFKYCNQSLENAVNDSRISHKYASDNCLMGLYIPTLLTLSYGFHPNTTNIKLTSSLGSGRIDWSLGAILVELSSLFGPERSQFAMRCNETMSRTMNNFTESSHLCTPKLVLLISLVLSIFIVHLFKSL